MNKIQTGILEALKSVQRYAMMFLLPTMILLSIVTCERRPLEDEDLPPAALIPVKIDWSKSGFNFTTKDGGNMVHRVSLRFYPKDSNRPVFDVYLEGDVTEGKINIPVGRYSVIVFNESVDDRGYWEGRINFTDANSYHDFAANAVPYNSNARDQLFPFYKPQVGEKLINEPLHLASWSIEHFEVTEKMVLVSYDEKPKSYISEEDYEMFTSLTRIVMRPLTRPVNVTARVENLISSHISYLAMNGFAGKVYMASGETTQSPTTYLFTLGQKKYEANNKNGTASATFYSFGRTPASGTIKESYTIGADILLRTGELYQPTPPLRFDVTGQVIPNYDSKVEIDIEISYALPFVEGGIEVEDWEDDVYTLQ